MKISQLPAASSVTNDDLIPVVQAGVTKQATRAQFVAGLSGGSGGAVSSVAGRTGDIALSTTDISGLGSSATHPAADFQAAGTYLTSSSNLDPTKLTSGTAGISITGTATGNIPVHIVAASDSPANIKAQAAYICTGTNDHLVVQQALQDNYSPYPEGTRIELTQGTYQWGGTLYLHEACRIRGQGTRITVLQMGSGLNVDMISDGGFAAGSIMHINSTPVVAGSGYVVGDEMTVTGGSGTATVRVMSVSAGGVPTYLLLRVLGSGYSVGTSATSGGTGTGCTVSITNITAASPVQGFFDLEGMHIDGFKMQAYSSGNQAACYCSLSQLTGLVAYPATGWNSNSAGRIWLKPMDQGGGNTSVYLYRDAGYATQVGHTANFVLASGPPCLVAITADNGSGLGGNIGIYSAPTNGDQTVYIQGNTSGAAINLQTTNSYDTHIRHMMIFNAAGDGITNAQGWGFCLEDSIIEYCGGNGVNITAGSCSKIWGCKIGDNAQNALVLTAASCMVTNCELWAGDSHNVYQATNLNPAGCGGLKIDSADNVVTNLQCLNVKTGNAGVWITVNGSRNEISNVSTTALTDHSTIATGCWGINNYGTTNTLSNIKAYNFSGTSSVGIMCQTNQNTITDSWAQACVCGVNLGGSNKNTVKGTTLYNCTTYGVNHGGGTDNLIQGCTFIGDATSILLSSGTARVNVSDNQFLTGATGISVASGAVSGLVTNNTFSGQTTTPASEANATGAMSLSGNRGVANYKAGFRVAVATNTTLTTAQAFSDVVVTADGVAVTLPSLATAVPGIEYLISNGGKNAAQLITLKPATGDTIQCTGGPATATGGLANTKATAISGDFVRVRAAGANTWYVTDLYGTWAVS